MKLDLGCPTSDTYRTMILDTTTNILVFIISLKVNKTFKEDINLCQTYTKIYNAANFQTKIV